MADTGPISRKGQASHGSIREDQSDPCWKVDARADALASLAASHQRLPSGRFVEIIVGEIRVFFPRLVYLPASSLVLFHTLTSKQIGITLLSWVSKSTTFRSSSLLRHPLILNHLWDRPACAFRRERKIGFQFIRKVIVLLQRERVPGSWSLQTSVSQVERFSYSGKG